jgi:hypothetical protein
MKWQRREMEITRRTSEATGIQKTARTLVVAFMAAEAQLGLVAKDLKLRDRVEQIMRAAQHSDLSEHLYRIVYTIHSLPQRRSTDDDHQIARPGPHKFCTNAKMFS